MAFSASDRPSIILGLIVLGGPVTGAQVRDVRLANELAKRGYQVHIWWAMDWPSSIDLDCRIKQHWLFNAMRYSGRFPAIREQVGKLFTKYVQDHRRAGTVQKRAHLITEMMYRLIHLLCDGVEKDAAVVNRFAADLTKVGVTHLLSSLAMLGIWGQAAREKMPTPCKHLVSFQGHELYLQYAQTIGRKDELKQRMTAVVKQADYPAIAVSHAYRQLILNDLSLSPKEVVVVAPGILPPEKINLEHAQKVVQKHFPMRDSALPMITYLGRKDSEKGIDLLLYAAQILRQRKIPFQLALCGSTLFGKQYRYACNEIIRNLEIKTHIMTTSEVRGELWTSLLTASHVVVYPSIVKETFGMVPVEAMAHGTPAIVPNYGGVIETIEANNHIAGLLFRPWDSGDLANKLEQILTDELLYQKLQKNTAAVANHYSVEQMTNQILSLLELH